MFPSPCEVEQKLTVFVSGYYFSQPFALSSFLQALEC